MVKEIRLEITLKCNECGKMISRNALAPIEEGVSRARESAALFGWDFYDGRDWCPACSMSRERAHA